MSSDEYWRGEADWFWAYRLAFLRGMEHHQNQVNETAWLHGLYTYDAVIKAIHNLLPLPTSWVKPSGRKDPVPYMEAPINPDKDYHAQRKAEEAREKFSFWAHRKQDFGRKE